MIDLAAMLGNWYRRGDRFHIDNAKEQVFSPYDFATELGNDLIKRGILQFLVQKVDLGTAGQLIIPSPGYHIVIYGSDGSDTHAVDSTVYMNMWLEKRDDSTPFPLKHARGFTGPFSQVILEWPAQLTGQSTSRFADVVIYKSIHRPWIDGEACT